MAYTDEALKAKLSTLNETQDSIVSVSQWIMFHKRHADRIASYWLGRLRDAPPPKRLNYIYLVNDIVQNARARKRAEFPDAFSPLMPEALQTAYRSSTPEIQAKLRRVVEVWRTRNVFETPIQDAIESRLDDIDKTKGSGGKKTLMGNSLFKSSSGTGLPKELETLAPLQIAVTKAIFDARPNIDTAQTDFNKLNDPTTTSPSPPVHAARLSGLIKSLAAAESSVSASIKARQALVADLEKILEINRSALAKDEDTLEELTSRKISTEAKKREVEDAIMRGLTSAENSPSDNLNVEGSPGENGISSSFVPERPEVEELTPEPEDDFMPTDIPADVPLSNVPNNPAVAAALAGFGSTNPISIPDISATPPATRVRTASGSGLNGSAAKRRKTSHDGDNLVPDLGEMGMENFAADYAIGTNLLNDLDQDVDELLRQEGGGP